MEQHSAIIKDIINKGIMAETVEKYMQPVLKKYQKEILSSLEKGQNLEKLHGMAYIIKKLEQEILKDIAHKDDAVKTYQKNKE